MEQHQQKEQRKTTRNRGTPLPHLRELRRSAGMTQRELAELAGPRRAPCCSWKLVDARPTRAVCASWPLHWACPPVCLS